jgi:hypothetical protein
MISNKKISINQIDSSSLTPITAFNTFTSSYNTGSFTGSFIGSLEGTSSFATSASYADVSASLGYLPLNGDFSALPTASLPLSSSDTLVVNQGGVVKEVAVSDVGGSKRLYKIELPSFQIQNPALNEFVRLQIFGQYPRYIQATGVTDHTLLVMDISNVLGFVPFECVLKKIKILGATSSDGVISIWKTDSNGTSNGVELYYNDSLTSGFNNIDFTSSNINEGDAIQIFYTKKNTTQAWFCKLFLTFQEL